jgi:hypothetical protein
VEDSLADDSLADDSLAKDSLAKDSLDSVAFVAEAATVVAGRSVWVVGPVAVARAKNVINKLDIVSPPYKQTIKLPTAAISVDCSVARSATNVQKQALQEGNPFPDDRLKSLVCRRTVSPPTSSSSKVPQWEHLPAGL